MNPIDDKMKTCYPINPSIYYPNCQPVFYPQYLVMPKLASAYVPFQQLNCLYQPMMGLERGTIFPELDRPYGADPEYTFDQ